MKYVIDIDDTICKEEGPVIGRKPFKDRIEKINRTKKPVNPYESRMKIVLY